VFRGQLPFDICTRLHNLRLKKSVPALSSCPFVIFAVKKIPSSLHTLRHWAFLAVSTAATLLASAEPVQLGVLQPDPARASAYKSAGITQVVLSVSWDRFQPTSTSLDSAYVATLRTDLATYRRAGLGVVLDTGIQYPPAWLLRLPGARFRNQHGDAFIDPAPGMNVANFVFNSLLRERQHDYLAALFKQLGTGWTAVRLGGGWYGELNYPPAVFAGKSNCYWAFDDIAQGQKYGLPAGLAPCPVPGWKPGTPSPDHTSARLFLDWYLASLQNYHDWQIQTVRRHYSGPLHMLYPSWGIRSGQLDAAVATDLSGTTPAEKNGEISRGFDFARYIAGIRDPLVQIHCTWLDSNPDWSDDTSPDPVRWSPVHYLASLARAHNPPLRVSAENTGGGGPAALALSARRAREFNLDSLYWAFAPDLFDGKPPELPDLRAAFAR
jgi:hypothetical protein